MKIVKMLSEGVPSNLKDSLTQLLADCELPPCESGQSLEDVISLANSKCPVNDATLERHLLDYEVRNEHGELHEIVFITDDEYGTYVELDDGSMQSLDSVFVP